MKFIKSSFAKKFIIILIALLLFNVVYPSMSYAVDFGGILLQPIVWIWEAFVIPIDAALGAMIVDTLGEASTASDSVLESIQQGKNGSDFDNFSDYFIGPDTIFAGKFAISNNFFDVVTDEETEEYNNIINRVKIVIAEFYVTLRNIAALVMLAGLIFTGIRILLSANIPTKRTQYLMMLQDWLLGMVILICSHIIMIITCDLCEAITNAVHVTMINSGSLKWELIKKLSWSGDSTEIIINLIMYSYLGWLTIVFVISYFKRFFWTGILVVFAPIFSVMYAFGQQTKQMYTNWLREFILNAFIQPFHIIIYSVLLGIPLTISKGEGWSWESIFTQSDCLYCLFALTMIRPAEKYMRNLFGLNKGIANMASYDSGKQFIDGAVKTAVAVAKTGVAIGATVATAGAASGALGAAGGAGGALGSAGGALGEAGGALGEAGGALGEAGDALGALGEEGSSGGLGNMLRKWFR